MKINIIIIVAFALLSLNFAFSQGKIVINELMASNSVSAYDEEYDTPDWIELYNNSTERVNLKGYRISDRQDWNNAWQLPDITLQPNSYIIIFASGKNRVSSDYYIIETSGYKDFPYTINDKFRFEYISITGDFEMQVCIRSMRNAGLTGLGGIMLRESLNKDSPYAGMFCMSPQKEDFSFLFRDIPAAVPYTRYFRHNLYYPDGWLRLSCKGDTVVGYIIDRYYNCLEKVKIYFPTKETIYAGIAFSNGEVNTTSKIALMDLRLNGKPLAFENLLVKEFDSEVTGKHYYSNELHADFKLSRERETIYLWDHTACLIDSINYENLQADVSIGRYPDGSDIIQLFTSPTPEKQNKAGFAGTASEPFFSIKAGWFNNKINLILETKDQQAKIYYSTDGSEPADSLELYQGTPISIEKTTVVRARSYKENYLPSRTVTHTFFINDSSTLPVFSLSADPYNLWDSTVGIFVHENRFNRLEIPAYFEFWKKPSGEAVYSSGAGLKLHGSRARGFPQKPFRLYSRNKYGDKEFQYNFFNDNSSEDIDKLLLRNGGQDWWSAFIRDGFASVLIENIISLDAAKYRPVTMFINSEYWGLYNLRERLDEDHIGKKYDIPVETINLLENNNNLIYGSDAVYLLMYDSILAMDMSLKKSYDYACSVIDIENIIDYAVTEVFSANYDWPGNNLRYWNSLSFDSRWRWVIYDMDWTFGYDWATSSKNNKLDVLIKGAADPYKFKFSLLFTKLLENQQFENSFINRCADLLNTEFNSERTIPLIDMLAKNIASEIPRHQARWDSSASEWGRGWDVAIQNIKDFLSQRAKYIRMHYVEQFDLSGISSVKLSTNLPNAGKIKINSLTLDKLPWNGIYFCDVPVTIIAIPNEDSKFIGWSIPELGNSSTITLILPDTLELMAIFDDKSHDKEPVVINEIMYKPAANADSKDWIELYNPSENSVSISGCSFKDENDLHIFTIPETTLLKPKEFLVICEDINSFSATYPNVKNYIGSFDFGLGKNDKVRIFNNNGILIDYVDYTSEEPWYPKAYGSGATLELINSDYDNSLPESWQPSFINNGTPGLMNSVYVSFKEMHEASELVLMNYPNPARLETIIEFSFPFRANINMTLYNSRGVKMLQIVDNKLYEGGKQRILLNTRDYTPGIYFCRVESIYPAAISKIISIIVLD